MAQKSTTKEILDALVVEHFLETPFDGAVWDYSTIQLAFEPPSDSDDGDDNDDDGEQDDESEAPGGETPDEVGEEDPDSDEEGEEADGGDEESDEESENSGEDDTEGEDEDDGDSELEFDPDGEEEIPLHDENAEDEVEKALEPEPAWTLPDAPPRPNLLPGLVLYPDYPNQIFREFESFYEFALCATDDSLHAWNPKVIYNSSSTCSSHDQTGHHKKDWSGTDTFQEAADMALRTGWPEGRQLLEDALIEVKRDYDSYNTLEFSVAGAFSMVPNYCAGDPECMVIDPGQSLRNQKPIIRIDYNNWIHAGVSTKAMMLRGAAVISLANSLEAQGFSCELRIVGATRGSGSYYNRDRTPAKTWSYSITFKRAGEELDLDRAAYAIAHPSCMRRLAFALLEQHADLKSQMQGHYGSPTYSNPRENSTSIYIPGADSSYETADSAREAVREAAQELLSQIDLEKEAAQ
jgi:hypothetical protein